MAEEDGIELPIRFPIEDQEAIAKLRAIAEEAERTAAVMAKRADSALPLTAQAQWAAGDEQKAIRDALAARRAVEVAEESAKRRAVESARRNAEEERRIDASLAAARGRAIEDFARRRDQEARRTLDTIKSVGDTLTLGMGVAVGERVFDGFLSFIRAIPDTMRWAVESTADYAKSLSMTSVESGWTTRSLQEMEPAMDAAGVGTQMLTRYTAMLNEKLSSSPDTFARMGISLERLWAAGPEERFRLWAQAVSGMGSEQAKLSAAVDTFGMRTGPRMLKVLELMERHRQDFFLSDEDVAAAREFSAQSFDLSDNIEDLWRRIGMLGMESGLAGRALSAASSAVGWMARQVDAARAAWAGLGPGWKQAISYAAAVGAAVVAAVAGITALALAFSMLHGPLLAAAAALGTTISAAISLASAAWAAAPAIVAWAGALAIAAAALWGAWKAGTALGGWMRVQIDSYLPSLSEKLDQAAVAYERLRRGAENEDLARGVQWAPKTKEEADAYNAHVESVRRAQSAESAAAREKAAADEAELVRWIARGDAIKTVTAATGRLREAEAARLGGVHAISEAFKAQAATEEAAYKAAVAKLRGDLKNSALSSGERESKQAELDAAAAEYSIKRKVAAIKYEQDANKELVRQATVRIGLEDSVAKAVDKQRAAQAAMLPDLAKEAALHAQRVAELERSTEIEIARLELEKSLWSAGEKRTEIQQQIDAARERHDIERATLEITREAAVMNRDMAEAMKRNGPAGIASAAAMAARYREEMDRIAAAYEAGSTILDSDVESLRKMAEFSARTGVDLGASADFVRTIANEAERYARSQERARAMEALRPEAIAGGIDDRLFDAGAQALRLSAERDYVATLVESGDLTEYQARVLFPELYEGTVRWHEGLQAVAGDLSAIGAGLLGSVLGGVATVAGKIDALREKAARAKVSGGRGGGLLGGLFGDEDGGFSVGSVLGGAASVLGMASTALSIGKRVVKALMGDPLKGVKQVGRAWGLGLSDELAKAVQDDAKRLGISVKNALMLHLGDAIEESGKSFRVWGDQAAELLRGIASGAIPWKEGLEQVQKVWGGIREEAEHYEVVGDRATRQIIAAARAAGQLTSEMKAFLRDRATLAAEGGAALVSMLPFRDGRMMDEWGAMTRDQATALGQNFMLAFSAAAAELGVVEAADKMRDAFAAMADGLGRLFGEEFASELLAPVSGLFGLTEEGSPFRAAAEAGDALAKITKGIADTNRLTANSFVSLGKTAMQAFEQAKGAAMGSGMSESDAVRQAIESQLPYLRAAVSAAEQYGYTLDENTRALVEQAKAAGYAFPLDPVLRMASAIERMVVAMDKAFGLGMNLGESFGSAADQAERLGGAIVGRPGAGVGPGRPEIQPSSHTTNNITMNMSFDESGLGSAQSRQELREFMVDVAAEEAARRLTAAIEAGVA